MPQSRFLPAALLLALICSAPAPADERRDLSRFVVVGDSLAAGFQNFSLLDSLQANGPANLIAQQARITGFKQPLVPYPGIPNVLRLVSISPFPVVEPTPGPPPAIPRVEPLVQAANLAVPGQTTYEAIFKRPGPVASPVDALTNVVLGFPSPLATPGPARSQMESALALGPNFVLLWIGNNDVLFAALTGDLSLMTPPDSFAVLYNLLSRSLRSTNATMVMVNIPDVTLTPYFTSLEKFSAQVRLPSALVAQALGMQPGDSLRPGALPVALAILQGQQPGPLPAICPSVLPGLPGPGTACVLRAAEANQIRARIASYNHVIAARARELCGALVDVHTLVQQLARIGYKAGPLRLTTDFLGGLFSLDGIHPTNTGYAILANEILEQMKRQLHINITPVNVVQVARRDPLVPPAGW